MMEEHSKLLEPHVAKVNQVLERKNKDHLRMYKYQIIDAQKETSSVAS